MDRELELEVMGESGAFICCCSWMREEDSAKKTEDVRDKDTPSRTPSSLSITCVLVAPLAFPGVSFSLSATNGKAAGGGTRYGASLYRD
jgi:hypothetical protein